MQPERERQPTFLAKICRKLHKNEGVVRPKFYYIDPPLQREAPTYNFAKFSKQLFEMEKFWSEGDVLLTSGSVTEKVQISLWQQKITVQ